MVEAALAHTIKDKAEAAYARSDLLEKRRPLMNACAKRCARLPAEVATLDGRRLVAAERHRVAAATTAVREGADGAP